MDEGTQEGAAALYAACGAPGGLGQGGECEGCEVGECIGFEVSPHMLDRVEFGRVRGKIVGVESSAVADECLHGPGAVSRQAIPYEHDGAGQGVEQFGQEPGEVPGPNVLVGVQSKNEPNLVALGRDAQGGDGRDFLVRASALA